MQANFWKEVDLDRKFDVDIFGLQSGRHNYNFDIDNSFFQNFENSIIEVGSLKCRVVLEKSERLMTIEFKITGNIELICDRSLEPYDHTVDIDEKLIFKYGEAEEELDNNIYSITSSTQKISLGQQLFELISVSVPMKKLHPRFVEEEMENEDSYFYTSSKDQGDRQNNEESDEDIIDPRWEALKKLKDNIK